MADDPDRLARGFSTTNWDGVRGAAGDRERLNELLARYLPPLKWHLVCSRGLSTDAADDLLQSFVADKLLERDLVTRADPQKGRFRTFLLTALDRYLIDRRRAEGAAKAAPDRALNLDSAELDGRPAAAAPQDVFDVAWAMQVLGEAIKRMHVGCQKRKRPDLWGLFEGRILAGVLYGGAPEPFESLAQRLGFPSDKRAANTFATARNMFDRILREVLGEYSPENVAEGLADLRAAFGGANSELVEQFRIHLWPDLPEVTMLSATHLTFSLRELLDLLEPAAKAADVAAAFRHLMTSPVPLDLGDLSPRLVQELETLLTARQELLIRSVRELLHHPSPRLELLKVIKDFAKDNRMNPDSPLPREAATVLYYLCIAAALLRHKQRITGLDDTGLRKGFRWALDQTWVEEESRELLRQALQVVAPAGKK